MEENPLEHKETLDELQHHTQGWRQYLALSTALVAVLAAIASLTSGNFANTAILDKNEAVLAQSKASDQYSYYQAKGVKKNLADLSFQLTRNPQNKADSDRYAAEQADIQRAANGFVADVERASHRGDQQLHRHHNGALAVTFFQIAIALAAMSALLSRKSFWALSMILAVIGCGFLAVSLG